MTARKRISHEDFNQFQILNALVQLLAADPSSPLEAQLYYDSAAKRLKYHDGTSFVTDTARARHTGTQLAATISDFNTAVRTNRLDQMAAPTADVVLNSQKITGLATPAATGDAANKGYVDTAVNGFDWKASVRVATTAAGTLASSFENGDTIDGVVLATGDRILIKDQAAGADNGIYTVNASGAPTRAADADTSAEVTAGMAVFVAEGTVNADTAWLLTTNDAIVLDTTALTFTAFGGLGALVAGTGLTKTANTIDAIAGATVGSGGPGGGLVANADSLVVDSAVVVRKFAAAFGDGTAVSYAITHNLGTRDITAAIVRAASPFDSVDVYWEATDVNTITVKPDSAPSTNQYRVVVHA